MNFSKRLNLFGDEIFAALNERRLELEKQGKKIYNMSVGTPDFHTPDHIKKALMEAAADDQNWRYSLRDLPELLDAVCAYYKKRFHGNHTGYGNVRLWQSGRHGTSWHDFMRRGRRGSSSRSVLSGFRSRKQIRRRGSLLLSACSRA